MKSVLLCVVLKVVVFASLVTAQAGCPTGKGICVERKYCLDSKQKGVTLHKCQIEGVKHAVCCGVPKITLGKSCSLTYSGKKHAGKCVPAASCHPYIPRGFTSDVWRTPNKECAIEQKDFHCCPGVLLKELDAKKLNPVERIKRNDNDSTKRNEVPPQSQKAAQNAFPTCQTSAKLNGHCVPLQMCDYLYSRFRKELHKKNQNFANYLYRNKCPSSTIDSTAICCSLPANTSTSIVHPKAAKFDVAKCGPTPMDNKVLLGERAGLGQYPWMANLMYRVNKTHLVTYCSGSLIHPRFVLSAAHCKKVYLIPVAVRLGEYDLSSKKDCEEGECADPYKQYAIDKWISHAGHRQGNPFNDIALVRLSTKVTLDPGHIYPICLPLTASLLMVKPKVLTVTGWGGTENGPSSNVLLKADLNANAKECHRRESLVCARGSEMQGHCRGDSGGPLQAVVPFGDTYRTVLFGVVSGGAKDCSVKDETTGVSVLVGYHIQWILDNMNI